MIKMLALRLIHEENVTGYDLMKKIERITGRKPSSGTIYPMLKSMTDEGWIEGREDGTKVIYGITDAGREKIREFQELKSEYLKKIMETMSIAGEAFDADSQHGVVQILLPLFLDVRDLMEQGIPAEKIAAVVENARKKLKEMVE